MFYGNYVNTRIQRLSKKLIQSFLMITIIYPQIMFQRLVLFFNLFIRLKVETNL